MEKIKKLEIKPSVLISLRETSGYTQEDIAKKLRVSVQKIREVEEGKDFFTLTQIKRLADIYSRPLVAFFTDKIPKLPTIPDYRINREKKLTPEVYLAQRRAFYLSNKIAELSNKESKIPSFPRTFSAKELANQFREYLGVDLLKRKKANKILDYYKKVLEEKLSIAIIEYPLKAEDVRAFSIFSTISVIVLNENDEAQIKLFSLFHEICHLIKRTSGICSIEMEQQNQQDIESFCNAFAAEFLVPESDLRKEIEEVGIKVADISETYGVSKQVVMLRLLLTGFIDRDRYNAFKRRLKEEELKKKFGRRKWEKVFFNRVGNLAAQEVSNAYKKGDITFLESAEILNLKTKYAEKIIG